MIRQQEQRIGQKIKDTDNAAVSMGLALYQFCNEYGIGEYQEEENEGPDDEM